MYRSKIVMLICFIFLKTQCRFDCIDNSWHLTRPNDDKRYHYLVGTENQCNCVCTDHKQLADRCQCTNCGHYHIPKPHISIKEELESYKKNSYVTKKATIKDKKLCFDYSC